MSKTWIAAPPSKSPLTFEAHFKDDRRVSWLSPSKDLIRSDIGTKESCWGTRLCSIPMRNPLTIYLFLCLFVYFFYTKNLMQNVVAHALDPRSTPEADAGGSLCIWGQPDLHSKFPDNQGYVEKPCLGQKQLTAAGRTRVSLGVTSP